MSIIKSFVGGISNMHRGLTLMLEPGIQPFMADIRHLVQSYLELERRAAELRQD